LKHFVSKLNMTFKRHTAGIICMQRLSRSKLEAIIGSIPSGVVILELDGKISYVNNKALALYGCDPRGLELPDQSTKLMKLLQASHY
jgi:PAS domain-containing protein